MKTLLVLRHGKSSWSDTGLDDHERPLKARGKRAAKRIGEELAERELVPDRILSSSARRAVETARRASGACGFEGDVELSKDLYFTGAARHLRHVAEQARPDDERVLVVGHNPDLEELVGMLSGETVRLTTANLACIDFATDAWQDLPHTRGRLRFVLRPRELD